jgi:hypothetical protein
MLTTVRELREQVRQDLNLEGISPVPSDDQIMRALNRAKDSVVARLEVVDGNIFLINQIYTVTAGADRITLPQGDEGVLLVRRIVLVQQVFTDGSRTRIPVFDLRDESEKTLGNANFYLWRQRGSLWFSGNTGAPSDMTLMLYYHTNVPNLTGQDLTSSYGYIPEEWTDMIGMQAVLDLLPGVHPGRIKWTMRRDERLGELVASRGRFIADHPLHIRRQGEEGIDY